MLSGEWLYYQSQCLLLINHIEELAAFFFLFFNLKISFIVFVYLFLYLIGNLNLGVRSICFSFFFFSLVNLGQSHYPKRIFILFWHRSFSPKDVLPLFFSLRNVDIFTIWSCEYCQTLTPFHVSNLTTLLTWTYWLAFLSAQLIKSKEKNWLKR